jgi:hypothetical protein
LTLEIGGECAIPKDAKTRTYTAVIDAFADPRLTANHVITLSDATFASGCGTNGLAPGLGCNQFFAETDRNSLTVFMSDLDYGEGGQITERLQDGTWLHIVGHASGQFEGSIVNASGSAQLFYCPVSKVSAWEECAIRTTFCETGEFRLRFSRQQ